LLHDARHTMASLMLAQKVHPRVVMEIMGHSQISLTLGTYSHVAPELSTDAATGWDRRCGAPRTTATTRRGRRTRSREPVSRLGCHPGCQ
jgi:hypothetical protein